MAGLRVAAVTEQGDPVARFNQRDELTQLVLRFRPSDVLVVDTPECVDIPTTGSGTSFRRRAKLLQVDIADTFVLERRREWRLEKPGLREAATARVSTSSSIFARLSSPNTAAGLACSYPTVNRGAVFVDFFFGLAFISIYRSGLWRRQARAASPRE